MLWLAGGRARNQCSDAPPALGMEEYKRTQQGLPHPVVGEGFASPKRCLLTQWPTHFRGEACDIPEIPPLYPILYVTCIHPLPEDPHTPTTSSQKRGINEGIVPVPRPLSLSACSPCYPPGLSGGKGHPQQEQGSGASGGMLLTPCLGGTQSLQPAGG